ncbi:TniQ family protein [Vibrio sp. 404]|uniref:TniQ family protein n=1 Tax=Vibrio marinisediminis TaxID=2758441 RepID=A0A7W2ISC2_9VIBR|nr:TnsD family Tn7-like transposition protein [Vibrio marinisediminis]MBA5760943.1 TniQ family protein [Vibrio marinisediminis]
MHRLPTYLLKDESAYSIVARTYIASPHQSWKVTNHKLFGSEYVRLNSMLPGHIDDLAKLLNKPSAEVRLCCTGHPLIALGIAKKQVLLEMMRHDVNGDASNLYHDSRLAASKLSFGNSLKGCPLCLIEDEANYGIGYWHTIHQCHGVCSCPKHNVKLVALTAGDGGINHHYILPTPEILGPPVTSNPAEQKLSNFVWQLKQYLCKQSPIIAMSALYKNWLNALGYLTKGGSIRWKRLRADLNNCWGDLFNSTSPSLPLELSDFKFVPSIVHHDKNVHYIKHTLLMSFLSQSPKSFFDGPMRDNNPTTTSTKTPLPNSTSVLKLLDNGSSMRQTAKQLKCRVGYIKQLALREGRNIERRRQFITSDIERAIWLKAFIGEHRQSIADAFNLSVGAVEAIIQSHYGLAEWRHHLRMAKRKKQEQDKLLDYLVKHPAASRTHIKQDCGAYMWLYKHDRDWLYKQLPPAQTNINKAPINWPGRDLVVLAQLQSLEGNYASMSAIDRAVGGHSWLTKMKDRFPLSCAYAKKILLSE